VGGKLIEARYDLIRALNLRGLVAGSLIIDYYKVADTVPVEQYVHDVIAGRRFDTNLSKQLRKGFRVHSLIPNYCDCDTCANWGVEIVWKNPDYRRFDKTAVRVLPRQYAAALKRPFMPQNAIIRSE
jgi:hypothetical protein